MFSRFRSVYIAFDVFPAPKGSSTHIAFMLETLSEVFSPVLCLCLGVSAHPAVQVEEGITILRCKLREPNLLARAQAFGRFVEDRLSLLDPSPEIVVFRDPWGGLPAMAVLPRAPSLFEVNGLPSWELGYSYPALARRHSLMEKLKEKEWICLERCSRILTVARVTKEALQRLGVAGERIGVVPNAAAPFFFEGKGKARAGEAVYVGSLQPWQGVETAIRAAVLLKGEPGFRLRVIHNGKRRWLKRLLKLAGKLNAGDAVVFEGPLEREVVAERVASASFALMPLEEVSRNTRQGCCPLKAVEAMASATPLLASDLEVCRELVSHGQEGLLLPPGDPRAWAHAMRSLLLDRPFLDEMGRRARRRAWELHHPCRLKERAAGEFLSAVKECRSPLPPGMDR